MGLTHYLAMTAAEFASGMRLPQHAAWMACHFSPYGLGLSNLPGTLPPGSLLVLDDITPIRDHDPELIGLQLARCMEEHACSGLLLDFQRPGYPQSTALADRLADMLSFPVGVSQLYAGQLSCPVLLPPVPCHVTVEAYLAPWAGREVWLETALNGSVITLTETGANVSSRPVQVPSFGGFQHAPLHCHYRIRQAPDSLTFTLWRTCEDLEALLAEAGLAGVTLAAGLYQELGTLQA